MSNLEIMWTKVDEAPALATYSLLPIVKAYVGAAGVSVTLKDISRSEEHTSELQSPVHLVCRLLLEKKKNARRRLTGRGAGARPHCAVRGRAAGGRGAALAGGAAAAAPGDDSRPRGDPRPRGEDGRR